MAFKGKILMIDDDADLLQLVSYDLSRCGYDVSTSARGDEGAAAAVSGGFDLVILDLMLPGMDGLSVLGEIKKAAPDTEVIMLTAHGSTRTAVESMRLGAFDYIGKPFRIADLEAVAGRAVEKLREAQLARVAPAAPLDLNSALDGMKTELAGLAGAAAALEYRQDPGLPMVRIPAERLKGALADIVSGSARSAGGGRMVVTTRRGLAGEDAPPGIRPDDCAVLEVTAGPGAGAGLNSVRSVLRESGGDILAGDRPGGGTVLRVFLPAC